MSVKDVMDFIDRFGVAVGVLAVVGFSLWRIGRWTAPRLDSALQRHFAFMDRLDSNQVKQGEILDRLLQRQEDTTDHVESISVALAKVCQHIERVDERSESRG